MQAIKAVFADRLFPAIKRESLPAFALSFAVDEPSLGSQRLELARSNQGGCSLHLGFFARNERGADSVRESGQRDSQNKDSAEDFDQRKAGQLWPSPPQRPPLPQTNLHREGGVGGEGHSLLCGNSHWRASSIRCTRAVTGLMRSARRKPSRSRSRISLSSAVPSG